MKSIPDTVQYTIHMCIFDYFASGAIIVHLISSNRRFPVDLIELCEAIISVRSIWLVCFVVTFFPSYILLPSFFHLISSDSYKKCSMFLIVMSLHCNKYCRCCSKYELRIRCGLFKSPHRTIIFVCTWHS